MAHLKDLIVNGDARINGDLYTNSPSVVYGTCTTAAATVVKVIEITDPSWSLKVGNILGVKWTASNSASNVKFNVNGSGEIAPAYNTSRPYTGNSQQVCGYANRTTYYMFDGVYWVWLGGGYDANDNTVPSGYCTTGASTQTKGVTFTNYNLESNQYFMVLFSNTNTYAGEIKMNVNSKGAKTVWLNDAVSSATNYNLIRGSYICYYDGTYYYLRTDGKIPHFTGDACVEQSSTAPTDPGIVLWIEDSDIDGSGGGGSGFEVIDSLNSTSTTDALSANQGRVLNGRLTTVENGNYLTSSNIKDNLTTDSATDALSAKQGKALNTRLTALENDNLDSRLDTLEGENLDSRLDAIEAKNLVESTNISKIVMVTSYPSTPDPDTLYVKVASL